MVNPLDGVLHARYQTPRIDRGTNNYGGQDFGSPCPPPLIIGKSEEPNTSNTADVSRGTFRYFRDPIYLRGAPSGLGGMDGIIEDSNVNKQAINRVVNFMNKDYALIGDKIYVFSDTTKLWSESLALTGKDGTHTDSIGLYPVFRSRNNKPYLIAAWHTGNANWQAAWLNGDTEIWELKATATSLLNPNDSFGGIYTECQHKGKIYFVAPEGAGFAVTKFFWYDFENDTFDERLWGTTVRVPLDLCPFMGELYSITKDDLGNVRLHNLHEGSRTPTLVASYNRSGSFPWGTFNETLTTTNQYEGHPLMFVDNVFDSQLNSLSPVMYTSYITESEAAKPDEVTESNHGLHHIPYRSDGTGGLISQEAVGQTLGFRANPFKCNQNQQGTLIPPCPACLPLFESVKDERIVLRTFVDQKTRDFDLLGTTAIVISSRFAGQACGGSPGGGGDFTNQFYHKFVGSGNHVGGGNLPDLPTNGGGRHSMQFVGFPFKGTRHRAAVHERHGGGARHSVIDGNGNKIADIVYRGTDTTDIDGVIRIKYSIIPSLGNPSGSTIATRWFWDENSHAPENKCTLVGTSHGSISGDFTAFGITVDSTTAYYVDWQAKGDGVTRGGVAGGGRLNLNGIIILADIPVGPIGSPSGIEGLVAWFEANDSLTITSGVDGEVSQWLEKGGSTTISGIFQETPANQPTLIDSANNGLDGVRFISSNSEYLFGNESPIISNDASTIMIIYEPNSLTATDTMFSLSQDSPPLSGTIVDIEFLNASVIAGGTSDLLVEAQDLQRRVQQLSSRGMTLASGGETAKARVLMWTEIAFESESFIEPLGATVLTDIITDGLVESTGLQNTTFGRFSGTQIAGVYTGAGQYYDGLIYEVAVYDRNLSATELDQFRVYAENKYTLTV